jgi:hypothetical protein
MRGEQAKDRLPCATCETRVGRADVEMLERTDVVVFT